MAGLGTKHGSCPCSPPAVGKRVLASLKPRRDPGEGLSASEVPASRAGWHLIPGGRRVGGKELAEGWPVQGAVERSRLVSFLGWSVGGAAEGGPRRGSPMLEDVATTKLLENPSKDRLMPQIMALGYQPHRWACPTGRTWSEGDNHSSATPSSQSNPLKEKGT